MRIFLAAIVFLVLPTSNAAAVAAPLPAVGSFPPASAYVDSAPSQCDRLIKLLSPGCEQAEIENVGFDAGRFYQRMTARQNLNEFRCAVAALEGMLGATDSVLPVEERRVIARQVLAQCAKPTSINQGHHNTCAVAALEERLYTRCPSLVCGIVSSVAEQGAFITASGTKVSLDRKSLEPDEEACAGRHYYAARSYASQIFQIAAVNAYWCVRNKDPRGIPVARGSIKYVQVPQEQRLGCADTGERLIIDWSDGVRETVVQDNGLIAYHPSFGMSELAELNAIITGVRDKKFLLAESKAWTKQPVTHVGSAKELRNTLLELKSRNMLPAIVAINLNSGLLGATAFGAKSDWHAVNIIDYHPDDERVEIDNWWGDWSDRKGSRAVALENLYAAMCDGAQGARSVAVRD